ncbi:MAG TPA: tyrosine-type recombinase/integrase [Bacilli bacterium]|nr:tyrosine-type recombinase/integrase [Bacilli bacterium]
MKKFEFMSRPHPARRIEIEEAITLFLNAKKVERRSERTIKTYRGELTRFAKWFNENGHENLERQTLEAYISYLTYDKSKWDDHPTNPVGGKGLSARTVNNTIRCLKIFLNHLVAERYLTVNPIEGLEYQPMEDKQFEVFSKEQVKALLAAPNKRMYPGYRDYVMMLVLLDTGLRIGEMTSLKVSDVDFVLRQITVRWEISKTNRTRIIPISETTAKELHGLIEFCGLEVDDYLWLTQFGERYLGDQFAKMLKKYGERAGIVGVRVSPHTFRHTFATMYLLNGGDTFSLQKILGHTTMDMVAVYVRLTNSNIQDQHVKYSPVSNIQPRGRSKGAIRFK